MASAESRSGCTVVAHFSTGQGGEQHGSGKEKATGDPLAPFARLNKRLISTAEILISDQPSGDKTSALHTGYVRIGQLGLKGDG